MSSPGQGRHSTWTPTRGRGGTTQPGRPLVVIIPTLLGRKLRSKEAVTSARATRQTWHRADMVTATAVPAWQVQGCRQAGWSRAFSSGDRPRASPGPSQAGLLTRLRMAMSPNLRAGVSLLLLTHQPTHTHQETTGPRVQEGKQMGTQGTSWGAFTPSPFPPSATSCPSGSDLSQTRSRNFAEHETTFSWPPLRKPPGGSGYGL